MNLYYSGIFYQGSAFHRYCTEHGIEIMILFPDQQPAVYAARLTSEEALAFALKFGEKLRPMKQNAV